MSRAKAIDPGEKSTAAARIPTNADAHSTTVNRAAATAFLSDRADVVSSTISPRDGLLLPEPERRTDGFVPIRSRRQGR